MLADDPVRGAGYLTEHGDRGALPHLSATLDRLELAPGEDELQRCEEIIAVAQAIRTGVAEVKIDGILNAGNASIPVKVAKTVELQRATGSAGP